MIKSFEELTEERIGYGRYQHIVISLLGLIFIADGIEMSAMSLIFPLLKSEWDISENMQVLIVSALFIGFFFGSLIAGFLIDKIGRKQTLQYSITQTHKKFAHTFGKIKNKFKYNYLIHVEV